MRVTNNLIVMNFLARLHDLDSKITSLQSKITTGNIFNTPGENPSGASQVMTVQTALKFMLQYRENMNDGKSRLSYIDENLSNVGDYMQRARELAVQGANTYLTDLDRSALVSEINQTIHGIATLANADYNARYLYAGYQTLTKPFNVTVGSDSVVPLDIDYMGDAGVIGRNININVDIDVNFSGKDVYMENTEKLTGISVTGDALGYSGFFRINGQTISVNQTDSITDIRDRINGTKNIGVVAKVDPNFVLNLESLSAVGEIRLEDTGGSILEDLGLIMKSAHNIALTAPALPLIDSQGAIKTGAILAQFPSPPGLGVTIDGSNDRLVLKLGTNANDGDIKRVSVDLTQGNYSTLTDLVSMIQERVNVDMGEKKILVHENAGAIELETYVSGSTITIDDLIVGGLDDEGNNDTASVLLGLTATGGPEDADTAGTDGNDKFSIDLGISAHPEGVDIEPIEIDIDADTSLTLADLITSINKSIRESNLNGLVEARDHLGRLEIYTLKEGKTVLGADLQFADVTTGTLTALGIVNAETPARVTGTAPFPPGITITAGVDDSFAIDLGPSAMYDHSNPQPQTLTIPAGVYANAIDLANAINSEILTNNALNENVEAAVVNILGVDYVEIRTVATGSEVDVNDFMLSDITPGSLANMGLNVATVPGGGSTDGQGDITEPENLFASLIHLRDNLLGIADKESSLVELQNFSNDEFLGIIPGDKIVITANGNTRTIAVHKYTTLKRLADEASSFLGIGVQVYVTREGQLYFENISNQPINGLSIKAYDTLGNDRTGFNDAFDSFTGTMLPRSTAYSAKFKDENKYLDVSEVSISEVDQSWTNTIDFRSRAGSAVNRLELALSQSDSFEVQLRERKENIQGAEMTALITEMKAKENILQATLALGDNIFLPSLFDFLS